MLHGPARGRYGKPRIAGHRYTPTVGFFGGNAPQCPVRAKSLHQFIGGLPVAVDRVLLGSRHRRESSSLVILHEFLTFV